MSASWVGLLFAPDDFSVGNSGWYRRGKKKGGGGLKKGNKGKKSSKTPLSPVQGEMEIP